MKKAISIALLLIANIIILAHAAVPHHHHNGIIVLLVENHCTESTANHDFGCSHGEELYQHDNTSHPHLEEECPLNSVFTRPTNSPEIICSMNFDLEELFICTLFGINDLSLVENVGLLFCHKPYMESYHFTFSSNSIGLRAPPVC